MFMNNSDRQNKQITEELAELRIKFEQSMNKLEESINKLCQKS